MEEKLMRSLIDEELLANYDASAGFDLDHLAEFKVSCYEYMSPLTEVLTCSPAECSSMAADTCSEVF